MGADPVHPDRGEVVDGGAQRDRVGDVAGPGFEFPRQLVERGRLVGVALDHVAAGQERGHRFEQRAFSVQKPMPVGPHILCPLAARKSTSSACTSTGICGTDCAASTSTIAPAACARGTIVSSGAIVPIELRDVGERDELHADQQLVQIVEDQLTVASAGM